MSAYVLDSSALLALLLDEPGAMHVAAVLASGAAISAVNLSEVVAKLAERGMPEQAIREALDPLDLDVAPADTSLAYAAGVLRPTTRHLGLSLGDRFCLALGARLSLPIVTAERAWSAVAVDVTVQMIR